MLEISVGESTSALRGRADGNPLASCAHGKLLLVSYDALTQQKLYIAMLSALFPMQNPSISNRRALIGTAMYGLHVIPRVAEHLPFWQHTDFFWKLLDGLQLKEEIRKEYSCGCEY